MISELRQQIVDETRRLIGVKWVHQGRNREGGLDCVGLIVELARVFDWPHVIEGDMIGYSLYPDGEMLKAKMKELFHPMPEDYIYQQGDLLCYWIDHPSRPCHVGLVTEFNGMPAFVHVYSDAGKVIESPIDWKWEKRIDSVYMWRAVAEAEGVI